MGFQRRPRRPLPTLFFPPSATIGGVASQRLRGAATAGIPLGRPGQPNEATDVVNELFAPQSIHNSGPLGLNLTKSPCFLELIQNKLALAAKGNKKQATENIGRGGAIDTKSTAAEGMKPSEKLQASNFEASVLRIGDWEWKSRYKGDLVAKFYFAKSKVAWEILQEGLKSKIEIKCSEICSLRISCPKDSLGTLEIMVSVRPQFFKESSPRPYKSTSWHATTDFTGGHARNLSRHVLQCDPGIMDKHIANLLSGDHRLYLLSQENNINPQSSFPVTCCSVPQIPLSWSHGNSYGSDDDNLFGTEQTGESFPLHPKPMGATAARMNHSAALQGVLFPSSAAGTSMITEEPSGGSDQLKSGKSNWKEFFETTAVAQQPFMSNGGIMNGKGNHTNILVNSENSHSRLNYPSPPEAIRRFPVDSMTNRQVESQSQSSRTDHVVLYPSSEEPPVLRAPLKKGMLNWKRIFEPHQPSSVSNAGTMNNDFGNCSNNLTNSHDSSRGADHSSLHGEMTAWRNTNDKRVNQQVNLWDQASYNHGVTNQNIIQQGVLQCDFNGSETLLQNPPSNDNISLERMTLEQISQNLLRDDEAVNAVEEGNLLSAVNSLSCLIGQASPPLTQSSHSHASNNLPAPPAEPTEVIDVDTYESSAVDDWLLPMMESSSLPCDFSSEDMESLSKLLS